MLVTSGFRLLFYPNPKLSHFISFKEINLHHGDQNPSRTGVTSIAWCTHFCHNITSIMTIYLAIIGICHNKYYSCLKLLLEYDFLEKWSELPRWGSACSYKDSHYTQQSQGRKCSNLSQNQDKGSQATNLFSKVLGFKSYSFSCD